jgi:hypothetical protein
MIPQQSAVIKYPAERFSNSRSAEEIIRELIDRQFFTQTAQYLELVEWLNKQREYKVVWQNLWFEGNWKNQSFAGIHGSGERTSRSNARIKPLRSFYLKSFTSWERETFATACWSLLTTALRREAPEISGYEPGKHWKISESSFSSSIMLIS